MDVEVAVKEVSLSEANSQRQRADMLARAKREARNAAKLRDHPNIAAIHDVVIEDESP
ncbi:hypothetical protein [Amycolatopsis sp. cmx-11-51]|uniref:hypothetical protein n=1 Tax=Amycolatopsis sp. cmx-11-51 TaxID=2785797 RepID=UPI0039E6C3F4